MNISNFLIGASQAEVVAYIAGFFSVSSAIVSGGIAYRMHRDRLRYDREKLSYDRNADRIREVIAHLGRTLTLANDVFKSFDDLAKTAPSLYEEEMLNQTTGTLDVYAGYIQHLSSEHTASYPDELRQQLEVVRKQLSKIFLDLRRGHDARKGDEFHALMLQNRLDLSAATKVLSTQIIEIIKVELSPIQRS